jgi:hypothetical protein
MPRNCSRDFERIIDEADRILLSGTSDEVLQLKSKFALENVTHNDDVGSYVGYTDLSSNCR